MSRYRVRKFHIYCKNTHLRKDAAFLHFLPFSQMFVRRKFFSSCSAGYLFSIKICRKCFSKILNILFCFFFSCTREVLSDFYTHIDIYRYSTFYLNYISYYQAYICICLIYSFLILLRLGFFKAVLFFFFFF